MQLQYDVDDGPRLGDADDVDVDVLVEEYYGYLLQLADDVMRQPPATTAIAQAQTVARLAFADERRSAHARVVGTQVLVQVVQAVEKVAQVAAHRAQCVRVTVAADGAHERATEGLHDVIVGRARDVTGRRGETREQVVPVAVVRREAVVRHIGGIANLIPDADAVFCDERLSHRFEQKTVHSER